MIERALAFDVGSIIRDWGGQNVLGIMAPTTGLNQKWWSLGGSITSLFNFVLGIAGFIFVILFLVGGVQYLTAAGNEEATGKAKKLLVDAIIGLVIVLIAWAVSTYIFSSLTNTTL